MISEEILSKSYYGNTVEEYLFSFGVFFGLAIVFRIFRGIILSKLRAFAESTPTKFDDKLVDAFDSIHPRFYDLTALFFSIHGLESEAHFDKYLNGAYLGLFMIQFIISSKPLMEYFLHKILKDDESDAADQTAFNAIAMLIQLALWITAILLVLSNLGFNITSLAASLGIGGIAVALAVQNILGDLFSSLSIYLDKPFVVGDFIIVEDKMGHVEKIGLKTTRLKALQGEELVISNKDLTSARIQNFKMMQKRRVVFSIGVTYGTSLEKCKLIPEIIARVFENVDNAELNRATFESFGDFSLNYEIVYYHLSGDYKEYMERRQDLNLQIKEEFEKAGIDMAFPTQTIELVKG